MMNRLRPNRSFVEGMHLTMTDLARMWQIEEINRIREVKVVMKGGVILKDTFQRDRETRETGENRESI
jgi:hypothetical protein